MLGRPGLSYCLHKHKQRHRVSLATTRMPCHAETNTNSLIVTFLIPTIRTTNFFCRKMEPAPIDTEGLTRSRLEIFILSVVSLLLFWVRLKNGDQALQEMKEELAFRMSWKNAFLICYPNDITLHMDVAIKEGNDWRRGWVEKISRPSGMVRVRLGDHGWSIWQ